MFASTWLFLGALGKLAAGIVPVAWWRRGRKGLWGALALGLCAWLAARRTRPWVGLVLALSFSLWPPWMRRAPC